MAALVAPGSTVTVKNVGLNPRRTGLLTTLGEMGAEIVIANRREEAGEPVGDAMVETWQKLPKGVKATVAPGDANPYAFGRVETQKDGTFRIESDSAGTSVRGERSQFKLPVEDPADFPAIAEFGESACYELSGRLLRELIRRTVFATDNESSRYALGGVKLEWSAEGGLTAIGTDAETVRPTRSAR